MDGSNYPLFIPPSETATRLPKDWTEPEARRYFVWLTSSLDERVDALVRFLGETVTEEPLPFLERLGSRALWVFRKPGFMMVRPDRTIGFTDAGLAFAADLGLAVAQALLRIEGVHWEILTRPKSEASFNQPVLVGFGGIHLDPIRGGVPEARYAIEADDPTVWRRLYEYWAKRALTTST